MLTIVNRQLILILAISAILAPHKAFADKVVSDPSGPRPIPESYFNLHVRWGTSTLFWPTAPFHSWRLITSETHWYNLEPEKGVWRFDQLDRAVERAEWKAVEVLYTLGYPARWAADTGAGREWNAGAALPPRDMSDWEEYVRRIVSRYKGRIKHYELMNEPHFTEVDGGWRSTRHFPVAKMVEMARIASMVIKQNDPDAKLVSMSPSGAFNGIRRVDAFLKAGGGKYIDVVGFHFYSDNPEQIPELVSALSKVLISNGQSNLNIWNTESGFYIAGPDKPHAGGEIPKNITLHTPEQGGAFVSRSLVLGAAAGLRRFYWYSWDIPTLALTEGRGKVITPAGKSYIRTENWLRGATVDECRTADEKLWICSLSRGPRQARLVWNISGERNWMIPTEWRAKRSQPLIGDEDDVDSGRSIRITESPILIWSDEKTWGQP